MYFFDLVEAGDPEQSAEVRELGQWMIENIRLPGNLKKKIEAKLADPP